MLIKLILNKQKELEVIRLEDGDNKIDMYYFQESDEEKEAAMSMSFGDAIKKLVQYYEENKENM